MSKPKHIQLLRFLSKYGIGETTSISSFLGENYKQPLVADDSDKAKSKYGVDVFPICVLLRDLEQRTFIKLNAENENPNKWPLGEGKPVWFDKIKIEASVTTYGLDYLDQEEINTLAKKSNYSIIASVVITFIISILTLLYVGMNYSLSKDTYRISISNQISDSLNSVNVNKRLDTLTHLLSKLQQSLPSPKTSKTFPKQKPPE